MPAHYDSETLAQHFAQISERFGRIEAQLAIRAGNQLEAIKLYRAATNASFEEAQKVIASI